MRYKIYIALTTVTLIALIVSALVGVTWLYITGIGVLAVLFLTLSYRAVRKPLDAVQNGIYLLQEQDFSSRLCHTGQPDADHVVDLFNKIMDNMKAERLRNLEQDNFLRQLIDASPMGIAVCDFNGKITETNRAWSNILTPVLEKAINNVPEGETHTLRLAESQIVRISRLWFMDSGFRRQFILTERLTDEIIDAEKQLFNRIVRTIGHEVNNSLGSVISVLDSLDCLTEGDPLAHEALMSSTSSCHNLVKFVKSYSDIVKLPAPVPRSTNLNIWIHTIEPSLRAMLPANITLTIATPHEHTTASIDPMLMERVMVNIVKNASESIADTPDGKIAITVTPGTITVTDNGPGITPEASSRLFTPFFSTKRPDRGLGLMLIADILRSHRATFTLQTTSPRHTTFTITLP